MFVVWMSFSAMPSPVSAAITFVMAAAASARAAFTVDRVKETPSRRSATSAAVTTVPTPVTAIVCSGGLAGSAGEGPVSREERRRDRRADEAGGQAEREPAGARAGKAKGQGDRIHG